MKRTGEIILASIGAVIYGLGAILGGFMIWLQDNQAFLKDVWEDNPDMAGMIDFDSLIDSLGSSGWMILITSIIALLLGIISIVFLKGNRKPKASGIILIVTAVAIAIITIGGGIFAGLFYLIAGIMCLARKPESFI